MQKDLTPEEIDQVWKSKDVQSVREELRQYIISAELSTIQSGQLK
jgi:hypothetical protein